MVTECPSLGLVMGKEEQRDVLLILTKPQADITIHVCSFYRVNLMRCSPGQRSYLPLVMPVHELGTQIWMKSSLGPHPLYPFNQNYMGQPGSTSEMIS